MVSLIIVVNLSLSNLLLAMCLALRFFYIGMIKVNLCGKIVTIKALMICK